MSRPYPWWLGLAGRAAATFLMLLGSTWRILRIRGTRPDAGPDRGQRCIFALWHSRLLPMVFLHRGAGVAVLISQHRDGELIARVAQRLGYVTPRGSSTRGGEEGVRDLLRFAEEGHSLAITPDGPRGPAEQVKPGLAFLASRTGLPVLPVSCSAGSSWVLRSWDRFRIPLPFARVIVAYGELMHVPSGLSEQDANVWCARLEDAIQSLTREVAQRSGELPMTGEVAP